MAQLLTVSSRSPSWSKNRPNVALFKFDKDFNWWGLDPNRKCKICKALSLFAFKRREIPVEIPDDAAKAAEAVGAGTRVDQ